MKPGCCSCTVGGNKLQALHNAMSNHISLCSCRFHHRRHRCRHRSAHDIVVVIVVVVVPASVISVTIGLTSGLVKAASLKACFAFFVKSMRAACCSMTKLFTNTAQEKDITSITLGSRVLALVIPRKLKRQTHAQKHTFWHTFWFYGTTKDPMTSGQKM